MHLTIQEYLLHARGFDRQAYLERFPDPILVRRSEQQSLAPRDEYSSTQKMKRDPVTNELRIEHRPPSPVDQVLPISKTERNSFASKVLVGRTETNDLIIAHMTVSKHHAFFSADPHSGQMLVTDTGSTNGTRLNGQDLTPRDQRLLQDGDRLAFGDIQLDFYSAGSFYDLLLSLPALR